MGEFKVGCRVRVVGNNIYEGVEGTIVKVELDERDNRNREDIHWVYSREFHQSWVHDQTPQLDGVRWFYENDLEVIKDEG